MAEYIKKALVAREIRKLLRVRESAVDIFQAGFEYGVNRAWVKINKIPAADAAPVVHGHWCKELVPFRDKLGNQHFGSCCSKCGGIFDRTKFCGGCGAKMDEEQEG